MSTHQVLVSKIDRVSPIEKADRLELVHVKGWTCVTSKGAFKAGDLCVYIPIDSVLSEALEGFLFPPAPSVRTAKIVGSKTRQRTRNSKASPGVSHGSRASRQTGRGQQSARSGPN